MKPAFKPDCGTGPSASERATLRQGARSLLVRSMDQVGPCQRCRAELLIAFVHEVTELLAEEGQASVDLFDARFGELTSRSRDANALVTELLKGGGL